MINIKNIFKVLLVALFVCAYSGDSFAQEGQRVQDWSFGSSNFYSNYYTPPATENTGCPEGTIWISPSNSCEPIVNESAKSVAQGSGGANSADFCSSDQGIFTDLVSTGVKIFKQLRDLIYVVAGFGIIAVAVGGFFGNLNWKWLGAIIISLVVIATAGELVVLLTGCETFGSSLITNTLTHPTGMTTTEYNENYTEEAASSGRISWSDDNDKNPGYGTTSTPSAPADDDGVDVE